MIDYLPTKPLTSLTSVVDAKQQCLPYLIVPNRRADPIPPPLNLIHITADLHLPESLIETVLPCITTHADRLHHHHHIYNLSQLLFLLWSSDLVSRFRPCTNNLSLSPLIYPPGHHPLSEEEAVIVGTVLHALLERKVAG